MPNIKAIIFDWGGTLYDNSTNAPFPSTKDVLEYCSKKYPLAIVSFSEDLLDMYKRYDNLDKFNLRKYFKLALFHTDKNTMYHIAMRNLGVKPDEVLIIDDYMERIAYLKTLGCQTAWVQRGKFANELPNAKTGNPDFIIHSLSELTEIV